MYPGADIAYTHRVEQWRAVGLAGHIEHPRQRRADMIEPWLVGGRTGLTAE
jgi:hypothetical protein